MIKSVYLICIINR